MTQTGVTVEDAPEVEKKREKNDAGIQVGEWLNRDISPASMKKSKRAINKSAHNFATIRSKLLKRPLTGNL